MASSDNLASYEPWSFRTSFPDSWISESYARDAQTLTRALALISNTTDSNSTATYSVSPDSLTSSDNLSFNPFSSYLNQETTPITTTTNTSTNPSTPTVSNVSGSDPESGPKRQKSSSLPGPTGKVAKRKSRATKKSQTTFITADPADFRRMVQQVTGVRFGSSGFNSQMPVVSVLKPEAQRLGNRFQGSSGCLPTLDTSAFLLDHNHQQQQQQQQQVVMMASGSGPVGPGPVSFSQPMMGADFDSFSCFPTLESFM